MGNKVLVTGIGIVSCLGADKEENLYSLQNGLSGIGLDPERKKHHFSSSLTGIVKYREPATKLHRRIRNALPDHGLYAVEAIMQALDDAGLDKSSIKGDSKIGLIAGNDTCLKAVLEGFEPYGGNVDTKHLGSQTTLRGMNSTLTLNLAPYLGIEGISLTISAACSSSAHAVGLGSFLIRHGMQKMVIVGGAQEVSWHAMFGFDAMRAISPRESEPEKASRPFDKNRDGLVPSGGAAFLILEDEKYARGRGAGVYGEMSGYGFSCDGDHPVLPNGKGAATAMANALKDANLAPGDIDYLNAHATSTVAGDMAEARAINKVFGNSGPYISSTKSMTGHECWMSGASELAYCSLMMKNNFLAPNINLDQVDPQISGLKFVRSPMELKANQMISNSFGFGGTNVSLILSRYS